jgi:hypothetical protein
LRYVSIRNLEERVMYRMEQIYDARPPVTLHAEVRVPLADRNHGVVTSNIKSVSEGAVNEPPPERRGGDNVTYLGCAPFDVWYPIIRISGRNFITYLF